MGTDKSRPGSGLAYKLSCLHHRYLRNRKAASGLDLTGEQGDTDLQNTTIAYCLITVIDGIEALFILAATQVFSCASAQLIDGSIVPALL